MKLKDNLYTIIEKNSEAFRIELIRDNVIYRAHFPEQPITPGVCIVQIATELLEELLDKSLELIEIANAKYLSVINPKDTMEVVYNFKKIAIEEESKTIKVSVVVNNESSIFTKLSLVYRIND